MTKPTNVSGSKLAETELRHRASPSLRVADRGFVVVGRPQGDPEVVELVEGQPLLVGREEGAAIRIDEGGVSRRHASLLRVGSSIEIKDLGSKNGVLRNGQSIGTDSTALRIGDRVNIGPATLSIAWLSDAPGQPAVGETLATEAEVLIEDPSMRELYALLPRIAASPVAVLITGETGVGKELVAAQLHRQSGHAADRFVRLNCAAIPEGLVESELFGFERGAFTGADRQRAGHLEAASGGTLLLDEVGELPKGAQAKLLRALETNTIMRVGGNREIKIDLRVVSATNRDLQLEIREGRFRSDLYYRLNGVSLHVPPLRQRPAEIMPLARLFVARLAVRMNEATPSISSAAADALVKHSWPGNVRELRQAVERALVLAPHGAIEVDHLGLTTGAARDAKPLPGALVEDLAKLERQSIEEALAAHAGNRTHAARALGISRRTLHYKLDKYQLGQGEDT